MRCPWLKYRLFLDRMTVNMWLSLFSNPRWGVFTTKKLFDTYHLTFDHWHLVYCVRLATCYRVNTMADKKVKVQTLLRCRHSTPWTFVQGIAKKTFYCILVYLRAIAHLSYFWQCRPIVDLLLTGFIFSRPYWVVRSRLWYDVLSVCRLSVVCL